MGEIAYHAQLEFNFSSDVLADGLESICGNNEDKACELERNFIKCGILREAGNNSYEFLHVTFHEWALAHYLAQKENSLVSAVKAYWCDSRYDEVITLLWTHDKVDDVQREEATRFLIEVGYKPQRENVRRWRSGLKQSIVFWDLAGMQMPESLAENLWRKLAGKPELELVLSTIQTNQVFFIRKLVDKTDESVDDTEETIRINLARNLNLPIDMMRTLANDENEYVRRYLAKNPNISIDVMQKLANDVDGFVRWNLALNPNISIDVMRTLANDVDEGVRWSLAANQNVSIEVMRTLANDVDEGVRWSLATNLNVPWKILLD